MARNYATDNARVTKPTSSTARGTSSKTTPPPKCQASLPTGCLGRANRSLIDTAHPAFGVGCRPRSTIPPHEHHRHNSQTQPPPDTAVPSTSVDPPRPNSPDVARLQAMATRTRRTGAAGAQRPGNQSQRPSLSRMSKRPVPRPAAAARRPPGLGRLIRA